MAPGAHLAKVLHRGGGSHVLLHAPVPSLVRTCLGHSFGLLVLCTDRVFTVGIVGCALMRQRGGAAC